MRVVSWSIAAPTLPAEVLDHAKGVSREKALTFPADRLHILVSCAVEVERWIGRALWPGVRAATAIVRVSDTTEDVPLLPMLPVTTPVRPGRFRCSPDSYVLWRRPLGARHTMASLQSRPE